MEFRLYKTCYIQEKYVTSHLKESSPSDLGRARQGIQPFLETNGSHPSQLRRRPYNGANL